MKAVDLDLRHVVVKMAVLTNQLLIIMQRYVMIDTILKRKTEMLRSIESYILIRKLQEPAAACLVIFMV